ncbi:MAG: histidine phosphatase family protein [Alphaproteobacteria bacterium]|nr:histidine phosphatase family protein [Alphaproteobacteria bacterium]
MTWRPVDLDPVALVMVGKPARGKTYTARRLARYTNWLGYRSRVFNVGTYRRERLGAGQPASFFSPDNREGRAAREAMAEAAVDDLLAWLVADGEIAVLDATNSTRRRRAWIRGRCEAAGVQPVFVEVVCERPEVIARNVREVKVDSPDYVGRSKDHAIEDFFARIREYDRVYETLDPTHDADVSYVRLIDMGERIELNRIEGFLPGQLVVFLMHLHDLQRPVYLTRHGESLFNVENRIGGDPDLSPAGQAYAANLRSWVAEHLPTTQPLTVWTSTLRRTAQTAQGLGRATRAWKLLDEIDAGDCDGWTYGEVAERMPADFHARKADKFRYRYPRGESYQDLIARLEPVVLELERQQEPVLVIAHQAVLRALVCYLVGSPPERSPYVEVPLHTVLRITPGPYGSEVVHLPLGPVPAHPAAP